MSFSFVAPPKYLDLGGYQFHHPCCFNNKIIIMQQPKEGRGKAKLHKFPSLKGSMVRLLDERGVLCHSTDKFLHCLWFDYPVGE